MSYAHLRILAGALCVLAVCAGSVHADFQLVEDFDSLLPGPIDDQDGWQAAHSTSAVVADPEDPDNMVLAVTTDSTRVYHELPIADGTVRTVFLRFRFAGLQNYSFGLSGSSFPSQFGDFDVEFSMTDASNELRINDDGTYTATDLLEPDHWYSVWILVDNLNKEFSVWLNDLKRHDAVAGDILESDGATTFLYRGSATDLRTFFIKTGGGSSGNSGPLYIDDIYVEDMSGLNLGNPTVVLPDIDGDGDVDVDDYALLADCLGGPGVYPVSPTCPPDQFDLADVDSDNDVDLEDFARLSWNF